MHDFVSPPSGPLLKNILPRGLYYKGKQVNNQFWVNVSFKITFPHQEKEKIEFKLKFPKISIHAKFHPKNINFEQTKLISS